MAKKSTLYFTFNITSLSDIETLVNLIKANGNFTESDYYSIYRKAQLSSQPTRIIKRLERVVKPLLKSHSGAVVKQSSKSLKADKQKEELKKFFSISHKAKEFTLHDGVIKINGFSLFSTRITKVHPSWLLSINHDFYITQERNKNKQFYFVPASDLSLLLDEVHQLVSNQRHDREYADILNDWPNDFYKFLHLLSNIKNSNHSQNSTCITIISSVKETLPNDFLFVPLNDIIVNDGEITVNFENTRFITEEIILKDNLTKEFITDISWDKFKEYLFSIYYTDSIEFYEEKLKSLYEQQLDKFLTEIRTQKPKVFQTFVTKEHFQKIYRGNNRCYLKCDSDVNPLWSIDNTSTMLGALYREVYDEYTISERTKNELKDARFQFEAMFSSPLYDLFCSVKDIKKCFDTDTSYNLYEVTDSCWLKRDLPQYSHDMSKFVIVYFHEHIAHDSDYEWDTSAWFKSYLVWTRKNDCSTIFMYPTNKEYSNYRFDIDTKKCSIEFAAFFIFRYFSSGIKNKRQNITKNPYLKKLGIYSVVRF